MSTKINSNFLSDNIKHILSLIVIVLSFVYLFWCTFSNVKPDPQIIIFMIAANGQVLNYYLGSSSSSAKKDETIAAAQQQSTNVATPENIKTGN